jgi:hypothetical protein
VIGINSKEKSFIVNNVFEDILKLADAKENKYIGGYPIRKI